ncbi:MAG: NAD(+)/NADH kinase [Eubacteriales bacterium]|nr:NAD(+)/NADH kinase [Eubacteriales bacterium]
MKSFYIVTNQKKDPEGLYTDSIIKYLNTNGACVIYNEQANNVDDTDYCYTNADMVPDDVDCIIVLGGDGTLIQAARDLNSKNCPLLGVNIGTLGYLTDTDMNSVFSTLDNLFNDMYEIDTRMMLNGKIYRDDKLIYEDVALNDVVLSRHGVLRIIDFNICVNGEFLNSFSADGVIVATATGSTAYSLSAGGPIIQPNARTIMITPICAHTLTQRSIIFGCDDEITIHINDSKKMSEERIATFDGESYCKLITGDRVVIRRSEKVTRLIKTSKMSFIERIRKKM